jgi:hypothetical protein
MLPPNLVLKDWIRKDTLMQIYSTTLYIKCSTLYTVTSVFSMSTAVVSNIAIKLMDFSFSLCLAMTHDNADAKFSTLGIFETKRISVYV